MNYFQNFTTLGKNLSLYQLFECLLFFGNILKLYCKFLMLFRSLTWIMTDICYFGHNYIENCNNHFRYILNVPWLKSSEQMWLKIWEKRIALINVWQWTLWHTCVMVWNVQLSGKYSFKVFYLVWIQWSHSLNKKIQLKSRQVL